MSQSTPYLQLPGRLNHCLSLLERRFSQRGDQLLREIVIRADYAAVTAALELRWSNARCEGQVPRLKLLKRQMHGRANFDLLRQRVLLTP